MPTSHHTHKNSYQVNIHAHTHTHTHIHKLHETEEGVFISLGRVGALSKHTT